MQINQSTNYELFENIIGNRNLNLAKIEKITKDVDNGFNMLPYCPIVVSETPQGKFHIIDGQHRLKAFDQSPIDWDLSVNVLIGADPGTQAMIFSKVNLA